jgi:hypothetical protein
MKHDLLQNHETFWIVCALHFLPITSHNNKDSIVFVSLNDYTNMRNVLKCQLV